MINNPLARSFNGAIVFQNVPISFNQPLDLQNYRGKCIGFLLEKKHQK